MFQIFFRHSSVEFVTAKTTKSRNPLTINTPTCIEVGYRRLPLLYAEKQNVINLLFTQMSGDVAFLETVQMVQTFGQPMRRRIVDSFRRVVETVQRLHVRTGFLLGGAGMRWRYGFRKNRRSLG